MLTLLLSPYSIFSSRPIFQAFNRGVETAKSCLRCGLNTGPLHVLQRVPLGTADHLGGQKLPRVLLYKCNALPLCYTGYRQVFGLYI